MASVHSAYGRLPFLVAAFTVVVSLGSLLTGFGLPTVSTDSPPASPGLSPTVTMTTDSSGASAGPGIVPILASPAVPISAAAAPVISFEGLHFGVNGPYTDGYAPPDVQVAVGPNGTLEMVNLLGRISTKQGGEVRTFPLATFFGAASTDRLSDPKVRFDSVSRRWFATLTDVTTSSILLEVSATDDPTGAWKGYSVSTTTGCADQPLIGMSDLVVILSANDFSSCTAAKPAYLGVQYWVLNKTDLVNGATVRLMSFGPDPTLFSVQPATALGPSAAQFLVTVGLGPTSTLTLFSITGVPPGLVVPSRQNLAIRSAAVPPSAPQAGTKNSLDTGDVRVQDAMWAQDRLWLSLGDPCTPSGDNTPRSCVRLIEVDTANTTIAQDFDFGVIGKYLFYPALRTDGVGHLVVVFGESSPIEFPGLMVAERSKGDPPNTIGTPTLIRVGEAAEIVACSGPVCRYGDYFGASRDPSDPEIVWVAGEYGTSSGWATFIAAMAETVRLTLSYSVLGGGSGYAAPILTYVRGGQTATVTLTTTPTVYVLDAGTTWSVPGVLGGSTGSERWATNQAVSRTATGSATVTFGYAHQFSASFAYRVTGGGSGYAGPSVSYNQFALPVSNPANVTDWVDAGGAYGFPLSLGGSNASERWQADSQSVNGTVLSSGTIEVAYRHQAFLAFAVQGPIGSTVSPASGWYDVGAAVHPTVGAPAGWALGEWRGAGPGAYSGTQASPTILVSGPFSETAILYAGLTVTAGAGGSVSYTYSGGAGTIPAGSSHTVYVPPGTNVSLVESPSSLYAFSGWRGAASGNQSSVRVTVTAPLQVTANFALTPSAALALYSAIGVVILIAILLVVALVRRRRALPPPPPPEPPLPPPPPPP